MQIGEMVKFLYPTLHGPKVRCGTVTRVLANGVEVRMQMGGYITLPASDLTPVSR